MKPLDHLKNAYSYVDARIVNLSARENKKSIVVGALADITHEHGKSIVFLIEKELFASALSLVRPVFESGVKMLWLNRCATDQQFAKYVEKDRIDNPKTMKELVQEVENVADSAGILKTIHDLAWKPMSSYAHARYMQVGKSSAKETVIPQWNDIVEREVCQISGIMCLLTYSEALLNANAIDVDEQLTELVKLLKPVIAPENS